VVTLKSTNTDPLVKRTSQILHVGLNESVVLVYGKGIFALLAIFRPWEGVKHEEGGGQQ